MRTVESGKAVIHSVARVRRMFSLGLAAVGFLWLFVIPAF